MARTGRVQQLAGGMPPLRQLIVVVALSPDPFSRGQALPCREGGQPPPQLLPAGALLQAGLEECASWEELGRRLSAFAAREGLAPGEWVRGEGYDHNELAEGRHPARQLLDAACPGHPVMIQHRSGHVGVFNTLALERLGVNEECSTSERDPGCGLPICEAGGNTDVQHLYDQQDRERGKRRMVCRKTSGI